ncbi:MAG: YeeE/YedE family protein [Myxococcales bacterium]|nr:YeeE/YedE family protein [Myxococcales bacterium]USN50798.1 MAG: YeeE/YedE family protein [Myxococcales bacterium]
MSTELILGLITGIIFGFLLQKGRVLRFEKQIGALLFRDMTIFKFMLSAILVGMVGVTLLSDLNLISLSHKPMNVGGIIIGGGLFGIGWGIMGYCPGTSVGALGEGRWHAIFAVLGMILGAAIYAEIYPWVKTNILSIKDLGKISIPEFFGISQWLMIGAFWFVVIYLFSWFEKKNL